MKINSSQSKICLKIEKQACILYVDFLVSCQMLYWTSSTCLLQKRSYIVVEADYYFS